MRTITSFGDRTSGTSLIIASVSPTKITRSHGPITLWMWMFSTLLRLLVYSLTVGFCTISQQFQSVASKLSLFTNDPFSKLSGSQPLWFFAFRIAQSRTVWVAVFFIARFQPRRGSCSNYSTWCRSNFVTFCQTWLWYAAHPKSSHSCITTIPCGIPLCFLNLPLAHNHNPLRLERKSDCKPL